MVRNLRHALLYSGGLGARDYDTKVAPTSHHLFPRYLGGQSHIWSCQRGFTLRPSEEQGVQRAVGVWTILVRNPTGVRLRLFADLGGQDTCRCLSLGCSAAVAAWCPHSAGKKSEEKSTYNYHQCIRELVLRGTLSFYLPTFVCKDVVRSGWVPFSLFYACTYGGTAYHTTVCFGS